MNAQEAYRILGWTKKDEAEFEAGLTVFTAEDCELNAEYHEKRVQAF